MGALRNKLSSGFVDEIFQFFADVIRLGLSEGDVAIQPETLFGIFTCIDRHLSSLFGTVFFGGEFNDMAFAVFGPGREPDKIDFARAGWGRGDATDSDDVTFGGAFHLSYGFSVGETLVEPFATSFSFGEALFSAAAFFIGKILGEGFSEAGNRYPPTFKTSAFVGESCDISF